MEWRLVDSLRQLRAQVREAAPRAVPPATPATAWGTIGDSQHESTSDHSPHRYADLGPVPVVCAADFPHAPALGLDGGQFTEALRQSRDPRIGYVIFNRRIFSGHQVGTVPPYTWRPYSGSDPHDTHWHVSTVHTSRADDPSPWRMPAGAEMELTDKIDETNYDVAPADWAADPPSKGLTVGQILGTINRRLYLTVRGLLRLWEHNTRVLGDMNVGLHNTALAVRDAQRDVAALAVEVAKTRDAVTGLDLPVIGGISEADLRRIVREEVRSVHRDLARAVSQWAAGEPITPIDG